MNVHPIEVLIGGNGRGHSRQLVIALAGGDLSGSQGNVGRGTRCCGVEAHGTRYCGEFAAEAQQGIQCGGRIAEHGGGVFELAGEPFRCGLAAASGNVQQRFRLLRCRCSGQLGPAVYEEEFLFDTKSGHDSKPHNLPIAGSTTDEGLSNILPPGYQSTD